MLDRAESYSRRLISTRRRHTLYSTELASASAETGDVRMCLARSNTIVASLQAESQQLDARITQLLQEKQLCTMQIEAEQATAQRYTKKLDDCGARTEVLQQTVERMRLDIQRATLVLQQLVPEIDFSVYA